MANINHDWREEALEIYNYHLEDHQSLLLTAKHFKISKTKAYQYVVVGEFLSKNPDDITEMFSDCLNKALNNDNLDYFTIKTSEFFTIGKLIEKSKNFYIIELLNGRKNEFKFIAFKAYQVRPSFDWEVELWKKKDTGFLTR